MNCTLSCLYVQKYTLFHIFQNYQDKKMQKQQILLKNMMLNINFLYLCTNKMHNHYGHSSENRHGNRSASQGARHIAV